jgi:hypothetical protein
MYLAHASNGHSVDGRCVLTIRVGGCHRHRRFDRDAVVHFDPRGSA